MSREVAIALDVGTTSARAALVDARSGRILGRLGGMRTAPLAGRAEPEDLWRAIVDALDRAEAAVVHGDLRPLACGISVFWHSALLVGAGGVPVTPVLLWNDTDPTYVAAARRLRRSVEPEATRAATGAPIHPSFPGVKAAALLAGRPGTERAGLVLWGLEELIALRLFGRAEKSLSMASATGLWSDADRDWYAPLVRAIGLDPAALPEVVCVADERRRLTVAAAARWPRLGSAPWQLPRGDGALSNLGLGATGRVAALTVGTSAALRLLDPPAAAAGEGLPRALFRYALDPGRAVSGGALSDGGNLIGRIASMAGVRPAAIEAAAQSCPPGAGGPLVLPGLWGERSPDWPDEALGGIVRLAADGQPAALVRSAVDTVAAGLGQVAEALALAFGTGTLSAVRAGGGAVERLPSLAQAATDAVGLPLEMVHGGAESSALGAARLALAGVGVTLPPPVVRRRFEPRPEGPVAYRQLWRELRRLRGAIGPGGEG